MRVSCLPVIIAAALLCAGCSASGPIDSYGNKLESWVGADESELVSKWGAPEQTVEADESSRVLTYVFNEFQTGGSGLMKQQTCRTSFSVKNGVVAEYSYTGNWCRQEQIPSG